MTELEQLRADLATLERVGRIGGYANGYAVDPLIGQMRHKLEKLEAQQATADEWAEVKRFIDQSPDEGSNPMVKRYIRHLEAKVAELDYELRCERIDGGKVRDDLKAIDAEKNRETLAELTTILNAIPPACGLARELVERRIEQVKKGEQKNVTSEELDPRRVLATARDVLRHYSKFVSSDDGWNTRNLQQAINTIDFMAGTEAEPLKWEKQPHQSELEKAEKEMQGNG